MLWAAVPGQGDAPCGELGEHPSTRILLSSVLTLTCGWELQKWMLLADISASPSFCQGQE